MTTKVAFGEKFTWNFVSTSNIYATKKTSNTNFSLNEVTLRFLVYFGAILTFWQQLRSALFKTSARTHSEFAAGLNRVLDWITC